MFEFMKKKSGFALIQILIVIVVLAVVTVIAIPIISNITRKAPVEISRIPQRVIVSEVKTMSPIIMATE